MDEYCSKNIRDDLILFKNETLRDIKQTEKLMLEKYGNIEFSIIEKIENFNKQFVKFSQKIKEITSFFDNLKDAQNKVGILMDFKTKSENSIIDLGIKIKSLEKDNNNSFFNISNILKNSVIYPGIIGGLSKFKTFHDVIDYTLSNISQYKQFKDNITKEINNTTNSLDNKIESLRNQIAFHLDKTQALVNNEITSSEEKIQSILKIYDERIQNIRIENTKNDMNIKKEIEELFKNIRGQIEEINENKNDLFLKYNDLIEKSNQNNNDIMDLKEKYNKLSNYIKHINYPFELNIETERDNNKKKRDSFSRDNIKKRRDSISKSLFRILSANNNELAKSKNKRNERNIKEYIKDNKNQDKFRNSINKSNYKIIETYSNNNNDEYKENNKTNFFWKSQSYKRFSLFKKSENIMNNNKINNNNNINNISEPDFSNFSNLYNNNNNNNNIINKKKDIDDSFKEKTISNVSDKSTYVNLFSKNNFMKTNFIKNFSLNLDENEAIFTENNNDTHFKNIFSNNNNVNFNDLKKHKKHKYSSGFPRIITNQGERIIVCSHPVYHRNKFTNNINPNVLLTYKNNHKFILTKKENKESTNDKKNIINRNNQRNNTDNNKICDLKKNNIFITRSNNDLYNNNNFFKSLSNPNKIEKQDKIKYNNKKRNISYKNNITIKK